MSEKQGSFPAFPFIKKFTEVYRGLTKRQYAAIMLQVPEAEEEWLNVMIRRSKRLDLIQAAMHDVMVANPNCILEDMTTWVCKIADACLVKEAETREEK